MPAIDESQEWTLVSGEEENGRTIAEFSRPLLSCDEDSDLDILVSIQVTQNSKNACTWP